MYAVGRLTWKVRPNRAATLPEFDEFPSSLCAEGFQVVDGPGPVEFCGEASDPGGAFVSTCMCGCQFLLDRC